METAERGVRHDPVQSLALRVVESSVVWPNPGEPPHHALSPSGVLRPGLPRALDALDDAERARYLRVVQGIAQRADSPRWKAVRKDANLAKLAAGSALRDLLGSLPPAVRRAGLGPEVRRAGLAPADLLLALPDEALRALTDGYLATLPDDVRTSIPAPPARTVAGPSTPLVWGSAS